MSDSLFRRVDRIGRPKRQVKSPPSPSKLDRDVRIVCSIQQGLDPREVREILQRMEAA